MVRISTVLNILTYGIALLGYAPLSPFLDPVPRYCFPVALLGGFLADRKGYSLRGAVPTVVSVIFFIFYGAQFSRENLVGPAVNLLAILCAVRLISEKSVRNYLQIFALALFSLASSSLFTLHASFLAYLMLLLVFVAVALVVLTFHASDSNLAVSTGGLKTVLTVALLMPGGAVPLMLLFFVILPRTEYPLWNFLNIAGARVAGFSEKVQPGAAANVGEVKNAVFRATCERLPREQLYWRGAVLNSPVGSAWVRGEVPAGEKGSVTSGKSVHQTIYLEPGRPRYLFALNVPRRVAGVKASLSADFVVQTERTVTNRVKYDADSVLTTTISAPRGIDTRFYLQLPPSLSPRMGAVGRDIAGRGKSDAERVELLKNFYLARNLTYATSDLPVSDDPLDEFLFVKKRGNCEFFASSFALLMRAAGVPARLVGGYYGGAYNELGGYYLVTEDLAHVWVEVYLGGTGWVMVDPSSLSTNFRGAKESRPAGLAARLRMYLDVGSYYWNMAVITYDLEKQLQLVRKANYQVKRISLPSRPNEYWLAAAIVAVLLVAGFAVRGMGRRMSREERLLREFLALLRRKFPCGIDPSAGLHDLAALTNDPLVERFAAIYGGAIYHDRPLTQEEYRTLRVLMRALRKGGERRVSAAETPPGGGGQEES